MHSEKQFTIKKIRIYVQNLSVGDTLPQLPFHNAEQAKYMVKAASKIANHYELNKTDRTLLMSAVWFCAAGWKQDPHDPENAGLRIAHEFLIRNDVDPEKIMIIENLILLTKWQRPPANLLEEIFSDSYFYFWGKKSFFKKKRLLRRESDLLNNKISNNKDWLSEKVSLMEKHQFFTEFGRSILEPVKMKNLAELKRKLAPLEKINGQKDKGTETMFRITSSNNQRLSVMADQKAHLLITVNSIILSAIISLVLRRIDKFEFLLYPTILILTVCLAAMTLAILTTRPSLPSGQFEQTELDAKSINLLFFGNFYSMPLTAFMAGMTRVIGDSDYLYRTLIMDVYGQGIVLGKKYKLLRMAYNVFMFGLILAVVVFIAATFFHQR